MVEERRFSPELRDRLVELLGPNGALELMERVPQVPWHDVATKADLDALTTRSDLTREVAVLRAEIAEQFREFGFRMTTTMVTTMLGGLLTYPSHRSGRGHDRDRAQPGQAQGVAPQRGQPSA
jgi:hypothetical protein